MYKVGDIVEYNYSVASMIFLIIDISGLSVTLSAIKVKFVIVLDYEVMRNCMNHHTILNSAAFRPLFDKDNFI